MQNNPDSKPSRTGALRGSILMNAHDATMRERHEVYGDPYTDMNCAAEFEALYRKHAGDKYCAAHDEAMRRVFCKLARIACGVTGHHDSYVDLAAYVAIAAECQQQFEDFEALKQPQKKPLRDIRDEYPGENRYFAHKDEKGVMREITKENVSAASSVVDRNLSEFVDRTLPGFKPLAGMLFRCEKNGPVWKVKTVLVNHAAEKGNELFEAECHSHPELPDQMMRAKAMLEVVPDTE